MLNIEQIVATTLNAVFFVESINVALNCDFFFSSRLTVYQQLIYSPHYCVSCGSHFPGCSSQTFMRIKCWKKNQFLEH